MDRRRHYHPAARHALLRTSCFDRDVVARHAIGAGVVPVARRATDGSVMLLLAKEHHVPSWRGSFKWSAFEGGRHAHESVVAAALREWQEESMEVLYALDERQLHAREYVCKLTLNVVQNRRTSTPAMQPPSASAGPAWTLPLTSSVLTADTSAPPARYHVMYAVEVPYDEGCAARFRARRSALLDVRAAGGRLRFASDARVRRRAREAVGATKDAAAAPRRVAEGAAEGTAEGAAEGAADDGNGSATAWRLAQSHAETTLAHALLDVGATALPGVDVERDPASGELLRLSVHADYLEKEEVRWWSVPELQHVLHNGGRYHDEGFRAYFMPVLRGFLDFFASDDC